MSNKFEKLYTPDDAAEEASRRRKKIRTSEATNYDEADQVVSRERTMEEHEFRAKRRDTYRTVWQKILGREKTSAMDVAIEDALRMDAEIEKKLRKGKVASITEAIEAIEKEGKFALERKEKISKEDWAWFRALQFGGSLEENNFEKATGIIYQAQQEKKINNKTKLDLKKIIAPLVTKKIAELIQKKDGKNFVRAFYELSRLWLITPEGLPKENLQSPEIQEVIKESLIYSMKTSPEYFARRRDKWANSGFIKNKETINTLPEIQQIVKEKLIGWMQVNPEYFAKNRDQWEHLGIINGTAMNQLPDIQKIAKEKLLSLLSNSPRYFVKFRDRWSKLGIIDKYEANSWTEVAKQ